VLLTNLRTQVHVTDEDCRPIGTFKAFDGPIRSVRVVADPPSRGGDVLGLLSVYFSGMG
jgi:hypothetical protein